MKPLANTDRVTVYEIAINTYNKVSREMTAAGSILKTKVTRMVKVHENQKSWQLLNLECNCVRVLLWG